MAKKKERFLGRTPDGVEVESLKKYRKSWDALLKPLKAKGFDIIGFDPGLLLCDGREKNMRGSFDLPVYAAKRFLGLE
jgi:hypothetical protein